MRDHEVQHIRGTGDDVVQATETYEIGEDNYDGDAGGLRAGKQPHH